MGSVAPRPVENHCFTSSKRSKVRKSVDPALDQGSISPMFYEQFLCFKIDPKSSKRHWWLGCLFCASLGSSRVKAARKHVDEIDVITKLQFGQNIDPLCLLFSIPARPEWWQLMLVHSLLRNNWKVCQGFSDDGFFLFIKLKIDIFGAVILRSWLGCFNGTNAIILNVVKLVNNWI